MKKINILVINPGSTSTKVAVFQNDKKLFDKIIRHSSENLKKFEKTIDQYEFRKDEILKVLKENNYDIKNINVIAPRGGIMEPKPSGTYKVTQEICDFQLNSPLQHPSNLASPIALSIAKDLGIEAFFTDPPSTNEMQEISKISGLKEVTRPGMFHALNHKAMAKYHSKKINKTYEELNLIVAHLGGGSSIGAHMKGVVIDVTDGLSEGPFTPERSGSLPTRQLIDMCYNKKYTYKEMKKKIQGNGGINSYLGNNDVKNIVENLDSKSEPIIEAMILQISKEIVGMSATFKDKTDGIVITGGIAYNEYITKKIEERIKHIAKVFVYPGEREFEALAEGAFQAFLKIKKIKEKEWKK